MSNSDTFWAIRRRELAKHEPPAKPAKKPKKEKPVTIEEPAAEEPEEEPTEAPAEAPAEEAPAEEDDDDDAEGADELQRRIKAISSIAAPSGASRGFARVWQDKTVAAARPHIPVRTGATRSSIRPGSIRRGNATVVGKYTTNFIDAGSKAHVEPRQAGFTKSGRVSRRKVGSGKVLKFEIGGQTLFRRKVNKRAIAARPFKKAAAAEGLQKAEWNEFVTNLWNGAA